ncbi:MAG: 1-(5-phosphoribosyl)-5-[(5-phosphoribosylamino)methylideneamino]imidazole-4-carboxamide isomerase [Elusimicrobiota bacterium]|jgi:phosphoribosylformimino-5-aminoimidazole carboxamide ribotide isomerase|nr:1-(5-phosphoribosyl)-5-[(5-phosphoribosylamino)methylideneamino]imidazole-4-carboxamide isomerase [Elusimicrobiota bacterium]
MLIIPAIDIRNGNSVRLKQGKIENETIHSNDPFETAKLWKSKGAKRIHIVDLDAALQNSIDNFSIIKKICGEIDVKIEVGGGIRDMERIKNIFSAGADFAILGTAAVKNPEIVKEAVDKYGQEKIIIALDVKDEKVAVKGWKEISEIYIEDFVLQMIEVGIKEFIYTDVSRDGTLSGPDFKGLEKLIDRNLRIIVSGGIKDMDDIIKLKKYESGGVIGVIVGSAMYTGNFDLQKAIKAGENA